MRANSLARGVSLLLWTRDASRGVLENELVRDVSLDNLCSKMVTPRRRPPCGIDILSFQNSLKDREQRGWPRRNTYYRPDFAR